MDVMRARVEEWLDSYFRDLVTTLREIGLVTIGFVLGMDVGASTVGVGEFVIRTQSVPTGPEERRVVAQTLHSWGIVGDSVPVSDLWHSIMSTAMNVTVVVGVLLIALSLLSFSDKYAEIVGSTTRDKSDAAGVDEG
jgi:hypothetical protein